MEISWGTNKVEVEPSHGNLSEVRIIFADVFTVGYFEGDDCKKELDVAIKNIQEIIEKYKTDW